MTSRLRNSQYGVWPLQMIGGQVTGSGTNIVIPAPTLDPAGVPNPKLRYAVMKMILSVNTPAVVQFFDGAGAVASGPYYITPGQPSVFPDDDIFYAQGGLGQSLGINLSVPFVQGINQPPTGCFYQLHYLTWPGA
jgi:hypothetical protein